jgi:hypothetical protein
MNWRNRQAKDLVHPWTWPTKLDVDCVASKIEDYNEEMLIEACLQTSKQESRVEWN